MERQDLEQWKAKEVARLLALVETERRYYQEMVAMLPVALVVLTADRRISSANRAFRQTFGLRSSELQGKTIDQILPSERLIEKIHDAHTSGVPPVPFSMEHDRRPFSVGIVPIRNWDDESEIETLLVFQPGAAPVQAPIAPPAEGRLEIPAVVWTADALTLAFQSVRGDFEALLGFPASHWTGTPGFFETRIHPEDREATLALYHAAPGDASAEFRAVTASGEVVWIREIIRHGADTITGVMTSMERRRQIEDQLLRAGRTEALQGIAAKLAHDLNNPLMIVTGYAEELRASLRSDDPVRGDVDEILSATGRISGITTQLLQYTRKQALPGVPMDVTRALERLEESIARAAGERVAIHLTGEQAWALAEPKQFEEVILALVSQDREGARERTNLTIACQTDTVTDAAPGATLAPGFYTRLAIHDDGSGVEESKRKSAFEAFLSKPGEKTAGPALARAYAIVREWGGDIAFFSKPGQGSTSLVYLPHCPAPEQVSMETAPVAAIPAPAPPAPAVRDTILLVEDEPGIRALVRKILRRENYSVLEAGTAEEAIAMASTTGRIDLLVTDVMLPHQSGRVLAERLLAQRPDLKVLYVSGYTDDDAVRAGAIPPGSRFLQKPFTLGALVEKVKESLAS